MSKGTTVALLAAIVMVVVGAGLIFAFWSDFVILFKGAIGPMLALGGLLIGLIAWSEFQAAREIEKLSRQTVPPPAPAAESTPSPPPEQAKTEG
ncbi:MAG: hypothetical protein NZ959_03095 [Armatimonadetes bacterium]|nr:hypothetical protein [Armatimonadota bacterium]MDW8121562.1 hypothetical protein [Armatimonadota bacterium]